MDILIWSGAAFTLLGLSGLVICIFRAVRIRRARLDDAETRERLKYLVALNLGALAVSALGLMLVVLGVLLA